jgi:magnesium transporter
MTVTLRTYREGLLQDMEMGLDDISDFLRESDHLLWLDLEGATKENVSMLGREFGFHELALEDCLHPHQRPKIEQYGSYYFLVAYAITVKEQELREHEMAVFVGRNYLVTVRKEPAYDLTEVFKRTTAHTELCKEGGAYLLYVLLDDVVDGYFTALEELEDAAEDVEDKVFGNDQTGDPESPEAGERSEQSDIFKLKKHLLKFRRVIAPLREVLDVMQRQTIDVVTNPLEPYYRDVYDHVLRATDFLDNLRDLLSSTLEAHLAVISNRLNEVMKRLTSWGAIILVPTLIAGIYGMNFRHMPDLRWQLGYPMALGLMVLSAGLLYRAFKRRRWL